MLKVGDKIPEVELPDQNGVNVRLQDILESRLLVLFFYPKDDTPGCTVEACGFRDSYEAFEKAGAAVMGISSDSVRSHGSFASKYRLPYPLLSDVGDRVRSLFGVSKSLGLFPGRVTFIIDRAGEIRHIFSSQLQLRKHISEALKIVRSF